MRHVVVVVAAALIAGLFFMSTAALRRELWLVMPTVRLPSHSNLIRGTGGLPLSAHSWSLQEEESKHQGTLSVPSFSLYLPPSSV